MERVNDWRRASGAQPSAVLQNAIKACERRLQQVIIPQIRVHAQIRGGVDGICERAAPAEGVCVLETAQFHTCLILSELTVKDLWRRRLVVDVRRKLGATGRRTQDAAR